MKLLLIKLGKSYNAIRRDGLIKGGKRVLGYFGIFIKTLFSAGSGDVLIITAGVGDSAHYRAYSQAEELNLHGIKTSVMIQDNPILARYADRFKVFIFHRSVYTSGVAKLIKNIKEQKKEIIFETDDLVFDPQYIKNTDYYQSKMNILEKKQYEKGAGGEILKDPYVKTCVTTTAYLADILRKYPARNASASVAGGGKKVYISRNKITNHELEIAESVIEKIQNSKNKTQDTVNIGYFSGTASHNKDFATITEALMEVMEKYKNVRLLLAGPLDTESQLNKFKERIVHLPLTSRNEYYNNLAKADINLAPLVLNDPFCECKSELKFFEPGILAIPTVAVANRTFSETINDGVDGFLAANKEEWIGKLEILITDPDLRRKIGKAAREKVLKDYTNKNSHNEEYYGYLRKAISKEAR